MDNKEKYYVVDSGDWGGSIYGGDALFIAEAHQFVPELVKEGKETGKGDCQI